MSIKPRQCVCTKGDLQFFADGQCFACRGTQVKDAYREGILKHNRSLKRPSIEDYEAFDGAHCRVIYRHLDENWRCPGCQRTKFEILRWTTLFPHKPELRRPGWAGGYHEHHDHSGDKYLKTGFPWWFSPRFDAVVVCEQCNSADSAVKSKLKLPMDFSFSPLEIRQFLTPFAHGKHLVDYQQASVIYSAIQFPA